MSDKNSNNLKEIEQLKKKLHDLEKGYRNIQKENEYFKHLISNISDIIWVFDPIEQKFTYISESISQMLGYSPKEFIDKPISSLFTPDSFELLQLRIKIRLLKFLEDEIERRETDNYTMIHKDGHKVYTEVKSFYHKNKTSGQIEAIGTTRDITQRKKTEIALTKSEQLLKEAQKNANLGHWELDIRTNKLIWSDEIFRIFELKPQEFKATYEAFLDAIHPDDRNWVNEAYSESLKSKSPHEIEHRLLSKSGKIKYVREKYKTEHNKNGEPLRSFGTVQDITDQKRAQQQLKESEQKYKALFLSTGDGTFVFQNNKIVDCNDRAIKMLEGTKEELLGLAPWDISPTFQPNGINSKEFAQEKIQEIFKGKSLEFEWQHKKLNDELIDIEVYVNVVDKKKKIFISTWRDITERKKAEEKLKESEEKYRTLYQNTPVMLHSIDHEGRIISISNQWLKIMGYKSSEVIGKSSTEFLTEKSKEYAKNEILPIFYKKGFVNEVPYQFVKKNGEVIDVLLSAISEKDDNGNIIKSLAVIIDVTEKKKAEEALQASEEKYRSIFEGSKDGFVLGSENTKIIDCNQSFCELLGYSLDELKGKDYKEFLYDEKKDWDDLLLSGATEYGIKAKIHEVDAVKKDGSIIPTELTTYTLHLDGKLHYLGIVRNISERKNHEKEIYKTMVSSEEKERERYAKELHDGLGPLLSTSMIYLHTMLSEDNQETVKEYIDRTHGLLEEAVQSIREISNNLSPDILKKYGLTQAVRSFIEKIKHVSKIAFIIKSNLKCRLSETAEFTIYRNIIELVNNSVKYSKASKINIEINSAEAFLNITVSDNGVGFDFEKIKKRGKGFGLMNIENRIHKLGGQYQYQTAPGKGTKVLIRINQSCV